MVFQFSVRVDSLRSYTTSGLLWLFLIYDSLYLWRNALKKNRGLFYQSPKLKTYNGFQSFPFRKSFLSLKIRSERFSISEVLYHGTGTRTTIQTNNTADQQQSRSICCYCQKVGWFIWRTHNLFPEFPTF